MPVSVQPFGRDHIPAVRDFNERINAQRKSYRFPESPIPQWLPYRDSLPLYQEYFVALEDAAVRGAYIVKPQAFSFHGEVTMVADYHLPISEGIVDRRYFLVGFQMITDALKRHPLLFALGIGGYGEALAQMLKALKWSLVSCPFYFKVHHPQRFFREIVFLRARRSRRMLIDALALSGAGWFGLKTWHALKRLTQPIPAHLTSDEVESFSGWTDDVWLRAKDGYAMIAVRNAAVLNALYPRSNHRFTRIKVLLQGEVIGWAVILNTKMTKHKYFGNMQVGSIVDCLAIPGQERHVIAMATRHLERLGADISYHQPAPWVLVQRLRQQRLPTGSIKFPLRSIATAGRKAAPLQCRNRRRTHNTR